MRLKLLSCVLAITIALSTAIGATFAFFSDYESVSFTVSAASLEMDLRSSDIPCFLPKIKVTVTNIGTINADLWLEDINRQANAAAESDITAQFGIDLRNFLKDVTLTVSYNNTTNTFHIKDLDSFSEPLPLMSGIAPEGEVDVIISQNPGSVFTLNAPQADVFASVDTARTQSDIKAPEESPEVSTQTSETVEDTSASAQDTSASAEDIEKQPTIEPSSEDKTTSQPYSEFPSADDREVEKSAEPESEESVETEQSVEPSTEDRIEPEKSEEKLEEEPAETEQSSEPAVQDGDNVLPDKSKSAKAERSIGHYEEFLVHVPYFFEFVLKSSGFTSSTRGTGFTLIKHINIFICSTQPDAMKSKLEDEADEALTEATDKTTKVSTDEDISTEESETSEDTTPPSEPQTTAAQDDKDEPEREQFIEPATEPPTKPSEELKQADEPEELSKKEPALDVSEPVEGGDGA